MSATAAAPGRLEVIAGPMFAGKSEELLRRVRRAALAGIDTLVLTHAFDDRYAEGIATHTGDVMAAPAASDVEGLRALLAEHPDARVVALDEAQFFGPGLLPVVAELLDRGATVIVAGLAVTFDAEPFPPVPELMALADEALRLSAVCAVCGRDAPLHQRLRAGEAASGAGEGLALTVDAVGGTESYQARCRLHHGH